ncbi:COX assembly mitochondrial protein 2 homolog [Dendronephthya gigantea]|uniref:COX assembly mitochondrial protein 2 homolog n=1 Tax=Dendronephthya gigantea TaxID=151771 RepID=UPI00106AB992|nr:COX assembly mitochondrial protein 2 homolog [Dendronephthya gigantea]
MHSSLAPHLHEECLEVIDMLKACHEEHSVGKFFGMCNELKLQLRKCLINEREKKRRANAEKALQTKELWEKKYNENNINEDGL